ncbi:MAG: argF [Gemmataceae bacterium]|nr:argF [Gemmataceae bacterium]
MKHFLNLIDVPRDALAELLAEAVRLKGAHARGIPTRSLAGKVVALVFEKPSLRTRVSFESGVAQLGGTALYLPGNEVGLGWRESHADFARTIGQYVDALVLRVFRHDTVEGVARASSIPVVNGLSDLSHPCQVLADLLTVQELFGSVEGRTVAFVGDGNNVARSLAVGCSRLGAKFVLACPVGYGFDDGFREKYKARVSPCFPPEVNDAAAAVRTADVIYTDVWTSMGQEAEREERLKRFESFQVNAALLAKAPPHCKVLHCLPAHRGEEITDDVLDGPASAVFQQAGNRLHTQKAVLEWLMKG